MPTPRTLNDDIHDVVDTPGPWEPAVHAAFMSASGSGVFSFGYQAHCVFGVVYAYTQQPE